MGFCFFCCFFLSFKLLDDTYTKINAKLKSAMVGNFNRKLLQNIQDINILMVTSQWEGRGMEREMEED